ncbi:hypothetical protein HZB90_01370 [archaeon]|nr:hypothetical protein [archaeon]
MAKKADVTSFEQYDAGTEYRAKRAGQSAVQKSTALWTRQMNNIGDFAREEAEKLGCSVTVGEFGIVVIRESPHVGRLIQILNEKKTEFRAERDALCRGEFAKYYLGSCIDDLVDCGMHLLRTSPDKCLPDGVQHDVYGRFTKELTEVYRKYGALVSDAPGIIEVLNYCFLPRLEEQVETVRTLVSNLRSKGYIRKRSAENLLFLLFEAPRMRLLKQEHVAVCAPAPTIVPEVASVEEVVESPVVAEDVAGHIVEKFGLERPAAEEVSVGRSIEQVRRFYETLAGMVGEKSASSIVSINPAVLGYTNGKATKFLSNLEDVLTSQREAQQLLGDEAEEFEFKADNIPLFSDFKTLYSLKQKLFARMRGVKFPPKPAEGAIDVEEYKKKLLEKAGIEVEITYALISGKNLHFIGEVYMPAEYFRKNTYLKIDAKKMMHFADVFDELVRRKVLKKKPKVNPVYRFNPNINDIEDTYLREYMRITLHAEQIVAQEGELTLNQEIVQELYPSNGNSPKKPL